jgi:cytoskeletal protein CcmA (bactofilin family)
VVFRRDSKVDAFQRQISALRQQLGGEQDDLAQPEPAAAQRDERAYSSSFSTFAPRAIDPYPLDFPDVPLADERTPSLPGVPSLPAVPAVDSMTSIIANSAVWKGNFESTGSLHVHGRVEGTLSAHEDVFIAEEAEVDASVKATSVTVAGNVRGTIRCTQRFELLPHGRVSGDVFSPVIVIHEGAAIVGEIAMTSGSEAKGAPSQAIGARSARGGD